MQPHNITKETMCFQALRGRCVSRTC